MTTLYLKNNSLYEVSFVIFTSKRSDPIYSSSIVPGMGALMEIGDDSITRIVTEDYYDLGLLEFDDPGDIFPDNIVCIYKLENYHTGDSKVAQQPDNTLIGIEMRDGQSINKKKQKILKKK